MFKTQEEKTDKKELCQKKKKLAQKSSKKLMDLLTWRPPVVFRVKDDYRSC